MKSWTDAPPADSSMKADSSMTVMDTSRLAEEASYLSPTQIRCSATDSTHRRPAGLWVSVINTISLGKGSLARLVLPVWLGADQPFRHGPGSESGTIFSRQRLR
jgi:hypothetical protein